MLQYVVLENSNQNMTLYKQFRATNFQMINSARMLLFPEISRFPMTVCIRGQDAGGGIRLQYLHSLSTNHKVTKITMKMNAIQSPIAFTCSTFLEK